MNTGERVPAAAAWEEWEDVLAAYQHAVVLQATWRERGGEITHRHALAGEEAARERLDALHRAALTRVAETGRRLVEAVNVAENLLRDRIVFGRRCGHMDPTCACAENAAWALLREHGRALAAEADAAAADPSLRAALRSTLPASSESV